MSCVDENAELCPDISTAPPLAIPTTTQTSTTPDGTIMSDFDISLSPAVTTHVPESLPTTNSVTTVIVGGIIGGIIAMFLLVAVVLLAIIVLKKWNQHTINNNVSGADAFQLENPIYDGQLLIA